MTSKVAATTPRGKHPANNALKMVQGIYTERRSIPLFGTCGLEILQCVWEKVKKFTTAFSVFLAAEITNDPSKSRLDSENRSIYCENSLNKRKVLGLRQIDSRGSREIRERPSREGSRPL